MIKISHIKISNFEKRLGVNCLYFISVSCVFFGPGLRSLQDLMPFCLDFYKHGFGHELFSDCVKEYFINASTVSTESLAQQTLLTSSSDADPSIPRSVASIARTGDNEEGPIDRLAPTTSASSSSVLAPRDNSLNRIRVPNVTSGR